MTKGKYPPRHWAIVGPPRSGKSTFAAQMRQPLLVIDSDGRFKEILWQAETDAYRLFEDGDAWCNTNPDEIYKAMVDIFPGPEVGTVVVDSLTAIITPLVTRAYRQAANKEVKNKIAGYAQKATAMRLLQGAVNLPGADTLWVYHQYQAKDDQAADVIRKSIPDTELVRLEMSLNMELQIVQNGDKRGIKIVSARFGKWGFVLWDETGNWTRMPERIEAAVYAEGVTDGPPELFASPQKAQAWAVEQGAFTEIAHARNAYEKLKSEKIPKSAREMSDLWKEDVARRLAEKETGPAPNKQPLEEMESPF